VRTTLRVNVLSIESKTFLTMYLISLISNSRIFISNLSRLCNVHAVICHQKALIMVVFYFASASSFLLGESE